MKKTVSGLFGILALLFAVVIGTQFVDVASANFFPESAPQGIRIESEGSVTGTDMMQRNGNVYTFTGGIYDSIVVLRDNVVIDGAGYALRGDGNSTGVFLQDRTNVTIRNMEISNFDCGIKLPSGYMETSSRKNTILGNNITGNTIGIQLSQFTENNFVYDNLITNNSYGVQIFHSPNNVFKNNHLKNNQYNLWVYAETSVPASHFVNDIDDSNTVDGKPIYYWVNQHDKIVPSDAGYVALIDCSGITVQNLTLANNGQGVLLVSTNSSLITKNRVANNDYGIVVYGPYLPCAYNTMIENEIVGNTKDGINTWGTIASNIAKNLIADNKMNGVNAFAFTGGGIVGNNVTSNVEAGIQLGGGTRIDVFENYVAANGVGIHIKSSENRIVSNIIIENNGFGMYLDSESFGGAMNNTIHHNSFIDNHAERAENTYLKRVLAYINPEVEGLQVFIPVLFNYTIRDNPVEWKVTNTWDDGEEGNYWSDYLTRYPNAIEVEGLGVGNTPFYIDEKNIDRYPLLKPIATPEGLFPSPSLSPMPTLTPSSPEPFPATLIAASGTSVAIIGIGLLIYVKKRGH